MREQNGKDKCLSRADGSATMNSNYQVENIVSCVIVRLPYAPPACLHEVRGGKVGGENRMIETGDAASSTLWLS